MKNRGGVGVGRATRGGWPVGLGLLIGWAPGLLGGACGSPSMDRELPLDHPARAGAVGSRVEVPPDPFTLLPTLELPRAAEGAGASRERGSAGAGSDHAAGSHGGEDALQYTCPMHPAVVQDVPGACPECGMRLQARPRRPQVPEERR